MGRRKRSYSNGHVLVLVLRHRLSTESGRDCLIANSAVTLGRGYMSPNQLIAPSLPAWIDSWHPLINVMESGCV